MRRFHFPLDPLLRWRRRLEEEAQVALAERQRDQEKARAAVETARADMDQLAVEMAALQHDTVDAGRLAEADRYHHTLTEALVRCERQAGEAADAVEAARSTLLQRRMERESLERLRTRRLDAHQAGERREEQQSLDEAAVQRWGRE